MASALTLVAVLALGACACAAGQLDTVQDLHSQYRNVFRSGNRNAASHLWAGYVLNRSSSLQADKLELMFRGFCPVSGSIIQDAPRTIYRTTLPRVGGGTATGVVRHCCWPCICDTSEHVRVDTKIVPTADGPHRLNALVIGDPCLKPAELDKTFADPFSNQLRPLRLAAPEVDCVAGKLSGAVYSDSGHPIIGLLFNDPASMEAAAALAVPPSGPAPRADDPTFGYGERCLARKQQGYNSGMGLIFHLVASISPIPNSTTLPLPGAAKPLPAAQAEGVDAAPNVPAALAEDAERAPSGQPDAAASPAISTASSPAHPGVVVAVALVSGAALVGATL
uniref:Subtilisin n=1 Tax=Zooxanthella nutricula TaxID=1333877 RepID=A0A7S2L855_9DINO